MRKTIIVAVAIIVFAGIAGVYGIFQKEERGRMRDPIVQELKLHKKDSETPAAGVCDFARGRVAVANIYPDIPQPRCIRVARDQKIMVINMTDAEVTAGFGEDPQIVTDIGFVRIPPNGYFASNTAFGEYLEPGVHVLGAAPFFGPEIWLYDFSAKEGYIKDIREEGGRMSIVLDEIAFLSGEEAENAAIEDGVCSIERREECLPNNFYIRNRASEREVFSLAPDASIVMQTINTEGGIHDTPITPREFMRLVGDRSLHWRALPYSLIVEGGMVTSIHEIYVP